MNNSSSADEPQTTPVGATLYSCPDPLCGLVFASMSNMRAHYRVKHMQLREFTCEKCGAAFGFRAVLRRHLASVHKDKLTDGTSLVCSTRERGMVVSTGAPHSMSATLSDTATPEQRLPNQVIEGLFPSRKAGTGCLPSTSMADHTLSTDSNSADKELSAAEAQILETSEVARCGEVLVDENASREKRAEGEKAKVFLQEESKQTNGTTYTSGEPCTESKADIQAGQCDGKDCCAFALHRRLTCDEWIADAVRLNLLPISVDGKL